jgi:hypothetical protein
MPCASFSQVNFRSDRYKRNAALQTEIRAKRPTSIIDRGKRQEQVPIHIFRSMTE